MARQSDIGAMSSFQILVHFLEALLRVRNEMVSKQVRQVLQAVIAMTLHWQNDVQLYHMFCQMFLECKILHFTRKLAWLQAEDTEDTALRVPFSTINIGARGFWNAALFSFTHILQNFYSNQARVDFALL